MKDYKRCAWCEGDALYEHYHDTEWGVPCYDDAVLFEFLVLESFQAGLSWITILRRRENFRRAFHGFDYKAIARYTQNDVVRLMADEGIIRHEKKIISTIGNARSFIKIQEEYGSFSHFIWSFVEHQPIQNEVSSLKTIPAQTEISAKLSQSLKKQGFSFLGATTIYAFMQAVGMVNDHLKSCFRHEEVRWMFSENK